MSEMNQKVVEEVNPGGTVADDTAEASPKDWASQVEEAMSSAGARPHADLKDQPADANASVLDVIQEGDFEIDLHSESEHSVAGPEPEEEDFLDSVPMTQDEAEEEIRRMCDMAAKYFDNPAEALADLYPTSMRMAAEPDFSMWGESEVQLEHDIDSKNRAVEAALQTDVFCVDSGPQRDLTLTPGAKHTRLFEVVGDYHPNLVQMRNGAAVRVLPDWKNLPQLTASLVRYVDARAPIQPKWIRYRLLNGKFLEIRAKNGPNFGKFPPMPESLDMPVYGILASLRHRDFLSMPATKLATPAELFDEAIERGRKNGRQLLLPYGLPPPHALPESKHFQEWRVDVSRREPELILPPALDAKSTLLECMKALEQRLTGASAERLHALKEVIHADMSEHSAENILLELQNVMQGGDDDFECGDVCTNEPAELGSWLLPDAEWKPTGTYEYAKYHIAGETRDVAVELGDAESCKYRIDYPMFIAPDNATHSTVSVLAYSAAVGHRLRVMHGHFLELLPWYVLSNTPRKQTPERGVMAHGGFWFERMHARVNFHGPVFFPHDPADSVAQQWALIFNTVWLEETVLQAGGKGLPRVYMWNSHEDAQYPAELITDQPRGLGILNGKLTISPLFRIKEEWRRSIHQDVRLFLPANVITLLLERSDVYEVENTDQFLEGSEPLKLRATIGGESLAFFHRPSMRFNPNPTSIHDLYWDESDASTSVDASSIGGASLHSRTARDPSEVYVTRKPRMPQAAAPPPPAIQPAVLTQQIAPTVPAIPSQRPSAAPTGVPEEADYPGNQVAAPPGRPAFDAIDMWSDKSSITKMGSWSDLMKKMKDAGLTEEIIKNYWTVHYEAAAGRVLHPVLQYHNPVWTDALTHVKTPPAGMWRWPQRKLAPHVLLSTNNEGHIPLWGVDAENKRKALRKKEAQRNFAARNTQPTDWVRGTNTRLGDWAPGPTPPVANTSQSTRGGFSRGTTRGQPRLGRGTSFARPQAQTGRPAGPGDTPGASSPPEGWW